MVMNIGRFFKEWRNPKAKCKRLGHKWRWRHCEITRKPTEKKDGYITWNRCAMVFERGQMKICYRCRKQGKFKLKNKSTCTSFSAPTSTFDTIADEGRDIEWGKWV